MKAVRLHAYNQQPTVDEVPRTQGDGSARRGGQDRRSGCVPHRPAHHPRSVGRADEPDAALHDRPRERGLGARDRLRGDERRRRRHRDPAPDAHLRTVPGVPGRTGHALQPQHVPRAGRQRRRHGGVPAHVRPSLREARSGDPAQGRCRVGRRGDHGLPRRAQGDPAALPRHHLRGDRRRRAGPHRHPVPRRSDRDEHRRGGPQPGRPRAGREARRQPHRARRRQARSTRSRTSPAARAPTSCSTSSPRRGPRTKASR